MEKEIDRSSDNTFKAVFGNGLILQRVVQCLDLFSIVACLKTSRFLRQSLRCTIAAGSAINKRLSRTIVKASLKNGWFCTATYPGKTTLKKNWRKQLRQGKFDDKFTVNNFVLLGNEVEIVPAVELEDTHGYDDELTCAAANKFRQNRIVGSEQHVLERCFQLQEEKQAVLDRHFNFLDNEFNTPFVAESWGLKGLIFAANRHHVALFASNDQVKWSHHRSQEDLDQLKRGPISTFATDAFVGFVCMKFAHGTLLEFGASCELYLFDAESSEILFQGDLSGVDFDFLFDFSDQAVLAKDNYVCIASTTELWANKSMIIIHVDKKSVKWKFLDFESNNGERFMTVTNMYDIIEGVLVGTCTKKDVDGNQSPAVFCLDLEKAFDDCSLDEDVWFPLLQYHKKNVTIWPWFESTSSFPIKLIGFTFCDIEDDCTLHLWKSKINLEMCDEGQQQEDIG